MMCIDKFTWSSLENLFHEEHISMIKKEMEKNKRQLSRVVEITTDKKSAYFWCLSPQRSVYFKVNL